MTKNLLEFWTELFWVGGGALLLIIFALTLGIQRHRIKSLPGSRGHRLKEDEAAEHEHIRADGYIDSFGKDIEEAGGGLPLVLKTFFVLIPIWWVLYLVLYWTP
jgi:hypothetical protein